MKKPIFITIILLLIAPCIKSQTYIVKYKSYSKDIDGDFTKLLEIQKNKKPEPNAVLRYSGGISWFGLLENSPFIKEDEENSNENRIATKRVITLSFYKDHNNKIIMADFGEMFAQFGERNLIKKEDMVNYNWTITDRKQKIAGYNCTLATSIAKSGEKISAFFTDQLAINEGPGPFWGLPGLILQLQVGETFFYTATSIKQEDKNTHIPTPKGNVMNPKEFDAYMAEMLKPRTVTKPDGTVVRISGSKN